MLQATKDKKLYEVYSGMASQYSVADITHMLEINSPELSAEYHKVWRSYQSKKNRAQSDEHTKELMRKKVRRLQEQCRVSNYRIYTDLNLNPGNVNAWLKHGNADKVSLDTARRTLRYMEDFSRTN